MNLQEMNDARFSVSELNNYIKYYFDNNDVLNNVAVYGEIYNYKTYPSGHAYFSLRDENCSLKCVMFSSYRSSLRYIPVNGMKVLAFGKVGIYPRDGVYQLYCSGMMEFGAGKLQIDFENLKKKLSAEGYFDSEHKKSIPYIPGTVVVITSSAGAAIHDILTILEKRWPLAEVILIPVKVQGEGSAEEISQAIKTANRLKLGDVIITGRGGGSIEDLWSFNTETVAKAIFESEIPVISAVGHEPDVTISDYTADVRAATPSNAAELCVPDAEDILVQINSLTERMRASVINRIYGNRVKLAELTKSRYLSDPLYYFDCKISELDLMQEKAENLIISRLDKKSDALAAITEKLEALSPLKILARGYALALDGSGKPVFSVHDVKEEDRIDVLLKDGRLICHVDDIITE